MSKKKVDEVTQKLMSKEYEIISETIFWAKENTKKLERHLKEGNLGQAISDCTLLIENSAGLLPMVYYQLALRRVRNSHNLPTEEIPSRIILDIQPPKKRRSKKRKPRVT